MSKYIIIDAPGYCGNKASIYSRHSILELAKKELKKHYVNIPGNGRGMSACIVERATRRDEAYVFWDGIKNAGYEIFGID